MILAITGWTCLQHYFCAITTVLNFFSTNLASYAMKLLPGLIGGNFTAGYRGADFHIRTLDGRAAGGLDLPGIHRQEDY